MDPGPAGGTLSAMPRLPDHRRIAVLTVDQLGVFTSKTAAALVRYRGEDVVAVIDRARAGDALSQIIPGAADVPIVSGVADAVRLGAEALYIGVAPVGGGLPDAFRPFLREALDAGLDVVSGLHTRLAEAELVAAASAGGGRIFDLRTPPADLPIASARARQTRALRVLTVGTDCNVGKMVAAWELVQAARAAGLDARFVATGQTGIMLAGEGIAIDAVVSDFAAGAVEQLVVSHGEADLIVVEGQGSIAHPGYSGVTLSLLHGACPDAMVLVHHLGRKRYRHPPFHPLPPLARLREAYERLAAFVHPAQVVAVAVNPHGVRAAEARRLRDTIERCLGLPVVDPRAGECGRILEALRTLGSNAT